ncbi:MAG: GNAT family protein [Gammaproteobacteria bacterium]|nr:GNAT family protein [Gammaproteobacteria bacterium]
MTAESIEIRLLKRSDLPAFNEHFARHQAESGRDGEYFMPVSPDDPSEPIGLDPARFEAALDVPGWQRWFVAIDPAAKRIVGHADLSGDRLRAGLHRCEVGVGIEEPWRGRGLGRRLMSHAIAFARQADSIAWVDLRVFAHNERARGLYRSLGFTEIGTVVDRFRIQGSSIDDVLMTLHVG